MINSNDTYENSGMIATRDPPLVSRPISRSQDGGIFGKPRNRPSPNRGFAVPKHGKWNENDSQSDAKCMDIFNRTRNENKELAGNYVSNNTAKLSAEPKKCFFPCFPFRPQRTQHLASGSAQAVSKNTTCSSNSDKKSDFALGSSYFGVQVFDFDVLAVATNNFDPSRQLGKGGFGSVYYGVLPDGCEVAVEQVDEKSFKTRVDFMMKKLRHANLVTLYGFSSRQSLEHFLVYEFIPNGTVADHLHGERAKSRSLPWTVRMSIAVETAEALVYLHRNGTIPRNIKTSNILLHNDFRVKVDDFGLIAPRGTPGYVYHEYHRCYNATEDCDVYSFGVVLVELISSLLPVDNHRHNDDIYLANMAVKMIQTCTLRELVDPNLGFETDHNVRRMVTLAAKLALGCLLAKKHMRPSMEKVLKNLQWIQSHDVNGHKVDIVDVS